MDKHERERLTKAQPQPDDIIHESPWPEWFASQDGTRGVWICDKTSEQKVKVAPPREWGRHWAWNITEDGAGIYFQHRE